MLFFVWRGCFFFGFLELFFGVFLSCFCFLLCFLLCCFGVVLFFFIKCWFW